MIAVSSAADGYVGGQAYKALYASILGPIFLKRTLFLEFPMYVFDPAKHSDVSKPGGADEESREGNRQDGRNGESVDGLV